MHFLNEHFRLNVAHNEYCRFSADVKKIFYLLILYIIIIINITITLLSTHVWLVDSSTFVKFVSTGLEIESPTKTKEYIWDREDEIIMLYATMMI